MKMQKNNKLEEYMRLKYEIALKELPDDEGGGWMATIPQLGSYTFVGDGETPEEALANLEQLKRYLFEEALKKGTEIPLPIEPTFEKFSGKFMTRIPIDLHIELSKQAEKNGMSLNSYVIYLLSKNNALEKVNDNLLSLLQEKTNIIDHDTNKYITTNPKEQTKLNYHEYENPYYKVG
jgi:antitoxin HicB